MSKKYVVFWLPTIFHGELKPKKEEIVNDENPEGFFDISDNSEYFYYTKLKLIHSDDQHPNEGIMVVSKVKTFEKVEDFTTELTLEYNQKRRNGFIQFSFDEDKIPPNCRIPFERNLTTSIYHKIKEFFHEHECHTGKDNDLHPIISDKASNLEIDDFPALMGFLSDFSSLFRKNAKYISSLNMQVSELLPYLRKLQQNISKLSKPDDIEEYHIIYRNVINRSNVINQLIENSLIEYTFCNTLLTSIYNKSFKHDIVLDTKAEDFEEKNNYRRQALNIRNSIRYIENIKFKNQNRHFELLHISSKDIRDTTARVQEQNNLINKTLRNDKKIQKLGVAVTIYGVFAALLFGFRSEIISICDILFDILLISLSSLLIIFVFLFVIFDITRKNYPTQSPPDVSFK